MSKQLVIGLLTACTVASHAAIVANWNFEDGSDGQPFDADGGGNSGSLDTVGGVLMAGWDATFGPSFTAANVNSGSLALDANGGQDGYVFDPALVGFNPSSWSIEVSVSLDDVVGWRTVIGRDGASHGQFESDFYLQKTDTDNWRLDYHTASGEKVVIDGLDPVVSGQWYTLRAMSDGISTVLDIDSGSGFVRQGTAVLTGATPAENALTSSAANWTFMRGWFDNGFGDHVDGQMDDVTFASHVIPEPATIGLVAFFGAGVIFIRRTFQL